MQILPNKEIRSRVVAEYCKEANISGVVCFSCGNASAALKKIGLDVLEMLPSNSLVINKWWTPEEIKKAWPDRFDATSGHLPLFLMMRIAEGYKKYLSSLQQVISSKNVIDVPTGSGETIICLCLAYPNTKFNAIYNTSNRGTKYEENAPLNKIVRIMANEIKGVRNENQ